VLLCGLLLATGLRAQYNHDVFGVYFNRGFNTLGFTHLYNNFTYIDSTFAGKGIDTVPSLVVVRGTFTVETEYEGRFIRFFPSIAIRQRGNSAEHITSPERLVPGHLFIKSKCLVGSVAGVRLFIPVDTIITHKHTTPFLVAANYFNQYGNYVYGWYVKNQTVDSLNSILRLHPDHKPSFASGLDNFFLDSPVGGTVVEVIGDGSVRGAAEYSYLVNRGSQHGVWRGMEFVTDTKEDHTLTVEIVNERTCIVRGYSPTPVAKGSSVSTKRYPAR
jgi:hypothetical protein